MLQEKATTDNDISEICTTNCDGEFNFYGSKKQSKTVRFMTVCAYVLSVSLAAIFLSIYYLFVWDGRPTLPQKIQMGSFETYTQLLEKEDKRRESKFNLIEVMSKSLENNVKDNKETMFIKDIPVIQYNLSETNYQNITDDISLVSDKLTSGINPTVDYEDTTSATQVNLTFFRDLQEFNQSMGNMKRSNVLIRKLIRHHNMMPK